VKEDPDFEKLHPNFTWLPVGIIQKTWECTTQFAKLPVSDVMKKRHKSPGGRCRRMDGRMQAVQTNEQQMEQTELRVDA
jgi:hypothetical protein